MSLEAGVIVDHGNREIHWHLPPDRTTGSLPDSYDLWQAIWQNRTRILGFAHSHPAGCKVPSHTDLTTFAAIEQALGMRLVWWIVTPTEVSLVFWSDVHPGPGYVVHPVAKDIQEQYSWLYKLREISY